MGCTKTLLSGEPLDNTYNPIFLKNIVADQLKEMRLELNQLNRKTGLLELKNVRQDGEIRFLRTLLSSIINVPSENGNKLLMAMPKRAARLLPLQLLM